MRRLLPFAFSVVTIIASCAYENLNTQQCAEDAECPDGTLCLIGQCAAPSSELGRVDLLVSPLPSTGVRPQTFLSIDAKKAEREELVLRPSLQSSLKVCARCNDTQPVILNGDLTLTGPEFIKGLHQEERATVDGMGNARASLLAETAYDAILFPVDPLAPLLRGQQVYSTALASGPLVVELPDPSAVRVLSGTVVRNDAGAQPVEGMRVWLMLGGARQVRDVVTDVYGHFSIQVLEEASSGLTLWLAPDSPSSPLPWVSIPSVNLDGNKDLGTISLHVSDDLVDVTGRVSGPDGRGVAAAFVKLEGEVGAGTLKLTAVTDADGNYSAAVPPGSYARAVIPPAAANAALKQESSITVHPSTETVRMDVTLGSPSKLCGKVQDSHQAAVANASVRALRIGNAEGAQGPASDAAVDAQTRTDGTGDYCVSVGPGRYLVSATPADGTSVPSRTDQVDVGSSDVTHAFDLPQPAFIIGIAKGPDGSPLRLARIRAYSPSPLLSTSQGALQMGETFTDDDGNFTLTVPDLANYSRSN